MRPIGGRNRLPMRPIGGRNRLQFIVQAGPDCPDWRGRNVENRAVPTSLPPGRGLRGGSYPDQRHRNPACGLRSLGSVPTGRRRERANPEWPSAHWVTTWHGLASEAAVSDNERAAPQHSEDRELNDPPDPDHRNSRAEGRPPEELVSDNPKAQAEVILEDSEARIEERAERSEPPPKD
jgi:hypothetical protein